MDTQKETSTGATVSIALTVHFSLRHRNTGLVSSRVSLTSWGEGASLAFIGHPSSENTLWGKCFITSTSFTPHLFLLGWLKLNLTLLLDQLRLA